MKIYNSIKEKEKNYFGENCGPNFYAFWPCKDMFATSGNYVLIKNQANQYYFTTQELEVFQIIFE